MDDAQQLIGWLGLAGAAAGFISRANQKHAKRWKSSLQVLYNDYTFEEYATITVLSLLYAIGIGALSGASAGALLCAFRQDGNSEYFFILSGLLFLGVPALRISVEGYTVIYKTAQDASNYFKVSGRIPTREDSSANSDADGNGVRSQKRTPKYQQSTWKEDFLRCIRVLEEKGIDISEIDEDSSFVGANSITVRTRDGKKIGEFTKDAQGRWSLI